MIEVGEPLYYYIIVCFLIAISFMGGVMFGSASKESKNEQKNSN